MLQALLPSVLQNRTHNFPFQTVLLDTSRLAFDEVELLGGKEPGDHALLRSLTSTSSFSDSSELDAKSTTLSCLHCSATTREL